MKAPATALACLCLSAAPAFAGAFHRLTPVEVCNTPSQRVRTLLPFSHWEFCNTRISEKGEVAEPRPVDPLHYLDECELSQKATRELAKLRPGLTRAAIEKAWWENGGLVGCEFLLREEKTDPKSVAVRIEWRPAAMPERVFADRKLR